MTKQTRKKQKRKLNGLAKMLMVLMMAVFLVVAGIAIFMPKVPESLRKSRNDKTQDNIEVLRFNEEGATIAVFYPSFDSEVVNKVVKEMTEELSGHFNLQEGAEVKADYTLYKINDQLASLVFDVTNNMDESVYYSSCLFDSTSGERIDTSNLFDTYLLRKISSELRYNLMSQESLSEVAYTLDFYEKTASKIENFNVFSVENGVLNIYISTNQYGTHPSMKLSFNLDQVANHVGIDMGVAQTMEDPKVDIPKRVIDPNRPMIALTYDDGPSRKNTQTLIETLQYYGQNATFFMVGNRIPKNEDVVLELINNGNEAASHSYSHPDLRRLSANDLNYQLVHTSELISELTNGAYEVKTYRPPYGGVNETVKAASPYPFIMWNIDTLDWKTRNADSTVNEIMNNVADGDIILMHDIHKESIEASVRVIPMLVEAGYQLVTVSEMMELRGITMQGGQKVFNVK